MQPQVLHVVDRRKPEIDWIFGGINVTPDARLAEVEPRAGAATVDTIVGGDLEHDPGRECEAPVQRLEIERCDEPAVVRAPPQRQPVRVVGSTGRRRGRVDDLEVRHLVRQRSARTIP